MDSLLNKTSLDEAEVDRSMVKIGVLAAVGVVLAFLFGFFLKLFIFENGTDSFLFTILAAVGFLIVFLLQTFFIKTLWRVNLIIFLETAALTAGFYDKISSTLLIAALVVLIILIWANYGGRRTVQNFIKIKFFQISKAVFPKAIMGLALFASVVYYLNISGGASASQEFFISQSSFEKIIALAAPVVDKLNILPDVDFSSSIGEIAEKIAEGQIKDNPQLQLLPEAAKRQMIDKAVKEIEAQFSDFLGAPLKPESTIGETFYRALVGKYSQLPYNIKSIILISIAAIIFLTIEGVSWPVRLVITILAWLVYEILLAAGFTAVVLEGKSREMVILK